MTIDSRTLRKATSSEAPLDEESLRESEMRDAIEKQFRETIARKKAKVTPCAQSSFFRR